MSSTGIFQCSGFAVQQTTAQRNITAHTGITIQIVIQLQEKIHQRGETVNIGTDKTAGHGSDHTGGNTFPAGITDHDKETVFIDLNKIIKVAADLFGGTHVSMNRKTSPKWHRFRQQRVLQIPGKHKFLIQTLLFTQMRIRIQNPSGKFNLSGNKTEAVILFRRKRSIKFGYGAVDSTEDSGHDPLTDQRNRHNTFDRDKRIIHVELRILQIRAVIDHLFPGLGNFTDNPLPQKNFFAFQLFQQIFRFCHHIIGRRHMKERTGSGNTDRLEIVALQRKDTYTLRLHQLHHITGSGIHPVFQIIITSHIG